jgi:hypothetical protein
MIATLEAERNAIVEDEASTHVNAKKIPISIAQGDRSGVPERKRGA